MKKTYTRCKVGLFVGLLGLHTLSSCSNKGQGLGVNFSREQFGLTGGQVRRNYNANPRRYICNKLVMPCLGFVATGLAIGGSLYWLSSGSNQATSAQGAVANGTEPSIDQITDNATALATTVATTLGTGLVNLGNTTVAPMVTTAATAAVTAAGLFTTAAGLMTTRLVNGLHSNSSSNRSYLEDNGIPRYLPMNTTDEREPFDLDDFYEMEVEPTEVNSNDSMTPKNVENSAAFVSMSDRLARGEVYVDQFGKAINEGLQIDEQDLTDGSTLLMKAVSQQPYRFNSVSTLITIGADVNLLNAKGENAFMVLVRNPNPGIGYQHSVKQLIRSRANIYQVDNAGRSGLDDIADLSFKTEIEALYNTTNIAN